MNNILFVNYGGQNLNMLNPNFRCILELADQLKKKMNVYIITDTEDQEITIDKKMYSEITIIKIPTHNRFKRKDINLNKSAIKKILEEINIADTKLIIGVVSPFLATILTLYRLKKTFKKSKIVLYEFDPFAFNYTSPQKKILIEFKKTIEKLTFKFVDEIWLTKELYNQYTNNEYSNFSSKMIKMGIPLLSKERLSLKEIKVTKSEDLNSKCINFVFLGTFYDEIRTPDYLLKLIKALADKGHSVRLNMYGSFIGEISKKTVDDFVRNNAGIIKHHGRIGNDKVGAILNNADIIVNIGNSIENQVPSKIFEYIESKKIILNLASIKNDTSKYYLKKYDLSILIHQTKKSQEHLENVNYLIFKYNELRDMYITNECIQKKFGEYTAEEISKKILNKYI